ncbi:MAG: VanZ family protein [Lachnospiraceae bacterium]|nr:VanZ family protein [Lachnospiraceae bacterium]
MKQLSKKQKRIYILLFLLYLALVVYLTCFGERMANAAERVPRYNLHPFHEIQRFWKHRDIIGFRGMFYNIFGNVLLFMPLGAFLCAVPKKTNILICFVISAFSSLLIETLQFCFDLGCFDVDDLILNTTGGLLGYILYWIFRAIVRWIRFESRTKVGNQK